MPIYVPWNKVGAGLRVGEEKELIVCLQSIAAIRLRR
jgi:hypothetical protein